MSSYIEPSWLMPTRCIILSQGSQATNNLANGMLRASRCGDAETCEDSVCYHEMVCLSWMLQKSNKFTMRVVALTWQATCIARLVEAGHILSIGSHYSPVLQTHESLTYSRAFSQRESNEHHNIQCNNSTEKSLDSFANCITHWQLMNDEVLTWTMASWELPCSTLCNS